RPWRRASTWISSAQVTSRGRWLAARHSCLRRPWLRGNKPPQLDHALQPGCDVGCGRVVEPSACLGDQVAGDGEVDDAEFAEDEGLACQLMVEDAEQEPDRLKIRFLASFQGYQRWRQVA